MAAFAEMVPELHCSLPCLVSLIDGGGNEQHQSAFLQPLSIGWVIAIIDVLPNSPIYEKNLKHAEELELMSMIACYFKFKVFSLSVYKCIVFAV